MTAGGSGAWGTGFWGTGYWGLGALSLLAARAIDTHTVFVGLGAPALALAPFTTGDALTPTTWTITDTITGRVYTVLAVTPTNTSNTAFFIHVLEALGPFQNVHTVSAPGLLTPAGSVITAPTSQSFYGVQAIGLANVSPTAPMVDLENNGALRITTAGDYAESSGGDVVRKLILRRLTTLPGGFFYLTDFGLGMRLKEPVTPGSLVKLRAEVERQVKQEPEVDQVKITLTLDARGILFGILRVRLVRGTDFTDIQLSAPGTQF